MIRSRYLGRYDCSCLTRKEAQLLLGYTAVTKDMTFLVPNKLEFVQILEKLQRSVPFTYKLLDKAREIQGVTHSLNDDMILIQFIERRK